MQYFKSTNLQNKKTMTRSQKRLIFSLIMVALPLLQFILLYIYVNLNSIILSFQKYQVNTDQLGYTVSFAGLDNFKFAIDFLAANGKMIVNSLILFFCNIFIVLGCSILFSYYITKKYPLSGLFKVILYIPQIVSSVVLAVLYKYIVTDVYISIFSKLSNLNIVGGLLDGSEKIQYVTVLVYNLWISFGVQVMLFSNAMSAIDQSMIESSHIDGASVMQEFYYITLPCVFPTFIAFFLTSMAGVFTNQMEMFTFFSTTGKNKFDVIGYYLYKNAQTSKITGTAVTYPELSALGVILTLILVPITIFTRKLFLKYGPSVD